jgi:CTP synthase (UTP-ammonia lyase)
MEMILKKYEINVVISAIGGSDGLLEQLTLVEAMKSINTIKVKFSIQIYGLINLEFPFFWK